MITSLARLGQDETAAPAAAPSGASLLGYVAIGVGLLLILPAIWRAMK
jgi:hypothetical protein